MSPNANILVLCLANRWRSPLAGALLVSYGVPNRTAGLNVKYGKTAGKPIIAAAAKLGLDLTKHVPQQVTSEMLDWADIVVCMNSTHAKKVLELSDGVPPQIILLGKLAEPPVDAIADLAFLSGAEFDAIVRLIQETTLCLRNLLWMQNLIDAIPSPKSKRLVPH